MITKIYWKFAIFAAIIMFLCILGFYGIEVNNKTTAVAGIIVIGTVCVGWCFWAMFVIRSMIVNTNRIISSVNYIREDIQAVRTLIEQDIVSAHKR